MGDCTPEQFINRVSRSKQYQESKVIKSAFQRKQILKSTAYSYANKENQKEMRAAFMSADLRWYI